MTQNIYHAPHCLATGHHLQNRVNCFPLKWSFCSRWSAVSPSAATRPKWIGLVKTAPASWPADKEGPLSAAGTPGDITPRRRGRGAGGPRPSPSSLDTLSSSCTPPPRHSLLHRHPPLFMCCRTSLIAAEPSFPAPPPQPFWGLKVVWGNETLVTWKTYVRPDASSDADNRRVPICNLGAFSGTGVNKDPQPNIDCVYVSRLHVFFFPGSWCLWRPSGDGEKKKKKKGERGSKENVNADKKKKREEINPQCWQRRRWSGTWRLYKLYLPAKPRTERICFRASLKE